MKWILASLAAVLMAYWLMEGRPVGNHVPKADVQEASSSSILGVAEKKASAAEVFSWGMPKKKAFLLDRGSAGQLTLEESKLSLAEIMAKSREDAVYAYRAWLLYYRCEKYAPPARREDAAETMALDACGAFVGKLENRQNELLYMAARAGLPDARLDYVIHAFESYTEEDLSDRSSARMMAAREAFSMVEESAIHGNVDAMLLASGAYDVGVVVDKDPVASYAFEYAAHKTGLLKNRDELLKLKEDDMTGEQINEAIGRGSEILRNCCME